MQKEIYDYEGNFVEGLARVGKDDKFGFIDKMNNVVVPLQYEDVWNFSEGLAAVQKDGKRGFVNKMGEEVIPCQYGYTYNFVNGLAKVMHENRKWGYVDKTGTEVVPCQYDDCSYQYNQGYILVGNNGMYGFYGWKFDKEEPYIGQIMDCKIKGGEELLDYMENDGFKEELNNLRLSKTYATQLINSKKEQNQER